MFSNESSNDDFNEIVDCKHMSVIQNSLKSLIYSTRNNMAVWGGLSKLWDKTRLASNLQRLYFPCLVDQGHKW